MAEEKAGRVAVYVAAFLAGLLGGAHCLGMCGGFVLAAAAGGQRAWLFHLGRLAGYAALGAVAALFGALLELGGGAAGLHHLRYLVSGVLLLAFGLAFVGALPRPWLEPGAGIVARLVGRARRASGPAYPLLLGLPIGLLPCGLLYPMYAAAAATGSPAEGAALLVTFGLGTVPLLGMFSLALERLGVAARHNLVRAAGVVMLVLGSLMLWQGWAGAGAHRVPGLHGVSLHPGR
jgi:sulfite exporter TauE/SafE